MAKLAAATAQDSTYGLRPDRKSKVRLRIFPSRKNSKKNLVSTVLWLISDFFTLKNDVNVPSKSNSKTIFKKIIFCWRLEGLQRKEQNPDPLFRGTDPRIRIRTKLSRIRNTALNKIIHSQVFIRKKRKNIRSNHGIQYGI
jgi:hypothetical protein